MKAVTNVRPAALAIAVLVAIALPAVVSAQTENKPRTFPQFAGTWVLDEAASTGRLRLTPRVPRTVTFSMTPETLTLVKRLLLTDRDNITDAPPPEVYRFDGTATVRTEGRYEYHLTFLLVADALVLTTKTTNWVLKSGFTLVTDAYSVAGDVLTLHRQLVSVRPPGQIATMSEPTNNFRHTYSYRREQPGTLAR
jgi:hypothetical protein